MFEEKKQDSDRQVLDTNAKQFDFADRMQERMQGAGCLTSRFSHLSPHFLLQYARVLANCRTLSSGIAPLDKSKNDPLTSRPLPERAFLPRLGIEVLEILRQLGQDKLSILIDCGKRMNIAGTKPIAANGLGISNGIELLNGERVYIPLEILDPIARRYSEVFETLRAWTWSIPDRALHYKPLANSDEHEIVREITDRDRMDVYGAALALGRLTQKQIDLVLSAATTQGAVLEIDRQIFKADFQSVFCNLQYKTAWFWRRSVEPGGTSHALIKNWIESGMPRNGPELSQKDKLFIETLSPGIVNYLLLSGKENIKHLTDIGSTLYEFGWDMDIGEFVKPRSGVRLMNGEQALLNPELLDVLAFNHHHIWLETRELTYALPNKTLHQPRPEERADGAHKRWDFNTVDIDWNPDRANIYGLTLALALLKERYPNYYKALLNSAA